MKVDPSTYKDAFLRHLERTSIVVPEDNLPKDSDPTLSERAAYSRNPHKPFQFEVPSSIYFFGAGGVASWFLPQFIKTLHNYCVKNHTLDSEYTIYIYDNDVVEEKNVLRQNFIPEDVGRNKAEVLSDRYDSIYDNIRVVYVDKYIYSGNFCTDFAKEYPEPQDNYVNIDSLDFRYSLVFNFVDNEITKHVIDFSIANVNNCVYFTTGCDIHNGQVFCKRLRTMPLYSQYYKDVSFMLGVEIIDEPASCAELAELAAVEQTFDSNSYAATILNALVNNIISDFWGTHTQEILFTCSSAPNVSSKTTTHNYAFCDGY